VASLGDAPGVPTPTETYTYDPLYRLTGVLDSQGNTVESYTYNKTGDRLSKTSTGGMATGAYGYQTGTHWLTSIGNAARTYDANGNTTGNATGGQTFGYGYDGRNRLTVVQANQQTIGTYTYNAFGERIAKAATSPQAINERFAYDESNKLLGEYGFSNRDYIWMDSMPVAAIDGSGVTATATFMVADGLGTPRSISNASGTQIWQWRFQSNPFGEQQPSGSYTYNLRFPGQYYDAESGQDYNLSRYYMPELGRYGQSDPSGLNGGLNTYAYSGSNSLNVFDDDGLDGKSVINWASFEVGHPGYGFFDISTETRGRAAWLTQGTASFKCNKFVWDALQAGGDPAGRMPDGRIPSASEWGNPNSVIPGYVPLPNGTPLLPGDIVGNGEHVAIYAPAADGSPLTISAAAPFTGGTDINGGVVHNDWGFRPGDTITAQWRSVGDYVSPFVGAYASDPLQILGLGL